MASLYKRGNVYWARVKGTDGKWKCCSTGKTDKDAALGVLEEMTSGSITVGPTFRRFATEWLETRHSSYKHDSARLKHHILPVIGSVQLSEVKPRHLISIVNNMKAQNKAPRTVRNAYSVLCAIFRDARLQEATTNNPCILTKHQLGTMHDKDPEWRSGALFSRQELESLISDERLSEASRVFYAVLGLAGLRHGEAAALRWRHLENAEGLNRLIVANSYQKGTKTNTTRIVPVHPTLQAALDSWKNSVPSEADDLMFPVVSSGNMRAGRYSLDRLQKDLHLLGFRPRRLHDLRRTFISLCRTDGARSDILKTVTHGASGCVLDSYTTYLWRDVCGEVAKLSVDVLQGSERAHNSAGRVSPLQGESRRFEPCCAQSGTLLQAECSSVKQGVQEEENEGKGNGSQDLGQMRGQRGEQGRSEELLRQERQQADLTRNMKGFEPHVSPGSYAPCQSEAQIKEQFPQLTSTVAYLKTILDIGDLEQAKQVVSTLQKLLS